ncbi:MAG: hypothetical protein JWO05_2015 [Gemmatimonadetes bacterium]|nr:hypothetical protein [Gemmatimonadota bacterium]
MTATTFPLEGTARRPRAERWRYFVPASTFSRALFGSVLAGMLLWPTYGGISAWIGPGLATAVFLAWHLLAVRSELPWLPGLLGLLVLLMDVIAPWLVYLLPRDVPSLPMALPAPDYFGYVTPAIMAFVLGMYLPLKGPARRTPPREAEKPIELSGPMRLALNAMIYGGLPFRLALLAHALPNSLQFVAVLAGYQCYVGAFAFTIARAPGWRWRLLLVVASEIILQSYGGQFLELLIWLSLAGMMIIYRSRTPRWMFVVGAVMLFVLTMALNGVKMGFREQMRESNDDAAARSGKLGGAVLEYATRPSLLFSKTNLVFNLSRFNEGWIIGRVLTWTPRSEPYAKGETIVTALAGAAVPRFMNPDKVVAGGFVFLTRFSGIELVGVTSMNYGIIGEMYANFGMGGIIACFVYGLLLGLLFATARRWSLGSPLWWAWVPFIIAPAISPELSTAEILNHVAKASLIAWMIIWLAPGWSTLPKRVRVARTRRAEGMGPAALGR